MKQRVAILFSLIGLFFWQIVQAQTAVLPVLHNDIEVNYPQEVTFHLSLAPDSNIIAAELIYDVTKFSCLSAETTVPVAVTDTAISWTWELNRSGNPPPGAILSWQWMLTDGDGHIWTTPSQSFTFVDERFEWQTLRDGDVTLHWYGRDTVGPTLLEAAVSGLVRLESEMGIQLQDDVQFFIYNDSQAMREAVLYINDWAGAVAFQEYNIILMGVPPHLVQTWGRSTVQHELAHLVVGQFGRSCVGGERPNWLEEGLAVYAEGEPSDEIVQDIEQAIRNDAFEPVRSLNGPFSAHGQAAGIAYSQSYSLVSYLLKRYGQEEMQTFLKVLAEGMSYDEALVQVYGFDTDGLEAAWRTDLNLPQRPFPPTPTPLSAAAMPTVVPLSGPVTVPTPPAAASSPTTSPQRAPICAFGLLPPLLLGVWSWRRREDAHD